jgi:hypothetical protein
MSERTSRKEKLIHVIREYLVNFAYLAMFFGVFTTYRRLLMAEYEISDGDYGISIIKALILAKVLMLGEMFRLGARLKDKPLIYNTLMKTTVVTAWVLLFHILEETLRGLLHGQGIVGGVSELVGQLPCELPAHILILFFAFLPFFAIRELGAILGEGKPHHSFFPTNRPGQH